MLMDILMESLMAMDDDSLEYVLESCSDEELEIIDNMVTEKAYSNVKRVVGNIFNGPEKTNEEIIKHGRSDEKKAAKNDYDHKMKEINKERESVSRPFTTEPYYDSVHNWNNEEGEARISKNVASTMRKQAHEDIKKLRSLREANNTERAVEFEKRLKDRLKKLNHHRNVIRSAKNTLKFANSRLNTEAENAQSKYNSTVSEINKANAEDAEKNSNSTSAQIGKVLHTPVSGLVAKTADALNTKRNTPSNGKRDKSKS